MIVRRCFAVFLGFSREEEDLGAAGYAALGSDDGGARTAVGLSLSCFVLQGFVHES